MSEEQQDSGKEEKKYKENLSKLVALLNGDDLLSKSKIPNSEVYQAMQELAKEEKAEKVLVIKEAAKKIIRAKKEFDAFRRQSEADLKKAIDEQQKKFNQEANKLFAMVENIKEMEEDYLRTLTSTAFEESSSISHTIPPVNEE